MEDIIEKEFICRNLEETQYTFKPNKCDVSNLMEVIDSENPDFISGLIATLKKLDQSINPIIHNKRLDEIDVKLVVSINYLSGFVDSCLQNNPNSLNDFIEKDSPFSKYRILFRYIMFVFSKEVRPHLADSASNRGEILTSLRDIQQNRHDFKRCLERDYNI